MLAGCSSALLSQRHPLKTEGSIQKMSTQSFDPTCNFIRKEAPRVTISLEKPIETRRSCSFRQKPKKPSSSLVAQTVSWEGRNEIEADEIWEKGKNLKRFSERSSFDDLGTNRAKRTRIGTSPRLVFGDDDLWIPQSIEVHLEEEVQKLISDADIFHPRYSSSNAAWFESDIVDGGENTSTRPEIPITRSGSSSSSDTHNSTPKISDDRSEDETGNRPQLEETQSGTVAREETQSEHRDLELVSLLVACVESISSADHTAMNYFLARLGELASPTGTPTQRLVGYFTEALALRAVKLWPQFFSIAPPRELANYVEDDDDDSLALRLLNQVSPIPKFLHFTLNERLLRAFEGKDRIHIIDFDIRQGLQWPSLFQSLASRPNPPTHVRITGIGESKQDLQDTGAQLAGLADSLKLPFEFHPVVDRLEDVRLWMLHVKEGESVSVNCIFQLHKSLYDSTRGPLMDLLGLIRSTNPSIVLVGEQEADHDQPIWEARLANSVKYYSAVFDSVDSGLQRISSARVKIEEMFAREIRNLVACEGIERVERHEIFDRWKKLMEDGGFENVGIGEREIFQSNMLLRMYPCESYRIEKQGEGDGLTLKWLDQPLYTVSAWTPIGIAGTSSTTSQPGG